MQQNLVKIAWRNVYKHRYYSLINVLGLSLALFCSLVLYLFISYHLSFDTYHKYSKRIYRAVTDLHLPNGGIEYDAGTPFLLTELFKQIPQIESTAMLLEKRSYTVSVQQNGQEAPKRFYEAENAAFTNSNWFKLFDYVPKQGGLITALDEPFTAVISEDLAKKYFNTTDAVGKTIKLDNKYSFTIKGVVSNIPPNTDVQANLFLSLSSVRAMYPDPKEFWTDIGFFSSKNHVYALLKNNASLQDVQKQIKSVTKDPLKAYGNAYQFQLQPLSEIHFDSRYSGVISKTLLWVLTLVGIAVIVIASFNFVNITTAQSLTRAKEIGTRKVLGGSRTVIFWQFILETAFVAILSLLIALFALFLFLPSLKGWLELPLVVDLSLFMFGLVILVLIIFSAGFYPAIILSRFKPINALKNISFNLNTKSSISRNTLIVLQNTIAQILIICTVIIGLQVKFLRNADLGFNKEAIVMIPIPDNSPAKLSYLRDRFVNKPSVKSVSFCYRAPASTTDKGGFIRYDNQQEGKFPVRSIIADHNYIQTFGLKLIAGRNLSVNDTNARAYIVTQALLSKLDIKKPEQAIGHKLIDGDFSDKPGTIVGVVKDFHTHSLYAALEPAVIASQNSLFEYAAVKIGDTNQLQAIAGIKNEWEKVFPENVFEYHFLDQQIADFYRKDEIIGKLIRIGTLVAILISCLGMLGLISLITIHRTKEIGIRKVLGASVASIVALLSKELVRLAAVAIVISVPIAWWTMHTWLQSFAYRTSISWWIFAIAAAIALILAWITISVQAIRAAISNPIKSLRMD
jgi:putative ABC transport system permease protein